MAELSPATGFWSYARDDDRAMAGHVLELAEQVQDIYYMKTTETITIFVDRHSIQWSQEWRSKISNSILGTTFFFPIISPLYLKSSNCREEFEEFWEAAKNSKVPKLLMPILYEDVDLAHSSDAICAIVRKILYLDWRETKLEDRISSPYRKLLNKMGKDLVAAAVQAAGVPEPEPELAQTPEKPEKEEEDDQGGDGGPPPEPGPPDTLRTGLLEDLVRVQELQGEINKHLAKAKKAMDEVVAQINRTPPPPNASAGQRLFHINAISERMRKPAEQFEAEAKEMEQITRESTDIVLIFADTMANPVFAASVQKSEIDKLLQMREQVVQQFEGLEQARAVVNALGRMSRKMKEPTSAVERGFDSLASMREMLLSWASAFEPVIAAVTERSSPAASTQTDSPPSPPEQA
jgi:hypothetical protein